MTTRANIVVRHILPLRGNTIQSLGYTGLVGEVTVDTDLDTLRIHDGQVAGGTRLATYAELANVSLGNIDLTGYSTVANAATQAVAINSLNANIGAFHTYANATFGTSSYGNANVVTYLSHIAGNVIPSANGVYSLGDSTHWWKTMYVAGQTIYIGGVALSMTANGLTSDRGFDLANANAATLTSGNVVSDGFFFANGVNILEAVSVQPGTYSNANVVAYMNSFYTYANATYSTVANAATQATDINALRANITAANSVVASNYSTFLANAAAAHSEINSLRANIIAANSAILGLQTGSGFATTAQLAANLTAANSAIVTANTGMKSYVDAVTTAWTANAGTQAADINGLRANITAANSAIVTLQTQTYSNVNAAAYLAGNVTTGNLTIEHDGVVLGNLRVQGTQTTVNAATLNITDLWVTVANNAVQASDANGAGIRVAGALANIAYSSVTDSFEFNKPITVDTLTASSTLKTNLINNTGSNQTITIDPDNSNLAYIKVGGFDDGNERVSISNQFTNSAGIYFYTETSSFRMYQNQFKFADDTWQTTAWTGTVANLTLGANVVALNSDGNVVLPTNWNFTACPAIQSTGIVFGDGTFQYTAAGPTDRLVSGSGNVVLNGTELVIPNTIRTQSGQYYLAQSDTSTEVSWANSVQAPNTNVSSAYFADATGIGFGTYSTDGTGSWIPKLVSMDFAGNLTVPSAILPAADNTQDLGSATMRFRHLYVGPGTVYVGNAAIKTTAAGNLILPGITRAVASSAYAEEVEDRGRQTHSFATVPTVIDNARFERLSGGDVSNFGPALYEVDELDDDGYIDGITITDPGTGYADDVAALAEQGMWATEVANPLSSFNINDWIQIPFRVRSRAGESEFEFSTGGGGGSSSLEGLDDVQLDGPAEGQVLTWNNSQEKWENRDPSGGNATTGNVVFDGDQLYVGGTGFLDLKNNANQVELGSNNTGSLILSVDEGTHRWEFDANGALTFPDNTVQTTAYTGGAGGSGVVERSVNFPYGETGDTSGTLAFAPDEKLYICIADYEAVQAVEYDQEPASEDYDKAQSINGTDMVFTLAVGEDPTLDTLMQSLTLPSTNWQIVGNATDGYVRDCVADQRDAGHWTFTWQYVSGQDNTSFSQGDEFALVYTAQPAIWQQIDTKPTTVGNTAPSGTEGALWYNTNDGRTYVYALDTWIDANPTVAPAPSYYLGNNLEITDIEESGNKLVILADANGDQIGLDDYDVIDYIPTATLLANDWIGAGTNDPATYATVTFANGETRPISGWNTDSHGTSGFLSLDSTITISGADAWPITITAYDYVHPQAVVNFGNNTLTVNHAGNLLVNGNLVTGAGSDVQVPNLDDYHNNIYINAENRGLIIDAAGDRRFGFMKYNGIEGALVHNSAVPIRIGRTAETDIGQATAGSLTTEMYIAANGKVGINTVGPTTQLDVNGVIKARNGLFIPQGGSGGIVWVDGSDNTQGRTYMDSGNLNVTAPNGFVATVSSWERINATANENTTVRAFHDVVLVSNNETISHSWTFNRDGNLVVPGNISGPGTSVVLTADTTDWAFYPNANLVLPANSTVSSRTGINIDTNSIKGIPSGVSNWNGQGGWNQGSYNNLATTGGTGTGLTVDVAAGGGGYINISAISIHTPGSGYTDGDVITINNENDLPGTFTIDGVTDSAVRWTFGTDGNLTLPTNAKINYANGTSILSGITGGSASTGNLSFNDTTMSSTADLVVRSEGNVFVDSLGGDYTWAFDTTGNLTLPNGVGSIGAIEQPDSVDLYGNSDAQYVQINWNNQNFVYVDSTGAHMQAGPTAPGEYEIFLSTDGSTTFPDHMPVSITGNLTVGNLIVNGNTTTINTTSYSVSDNIIQMAVDNPADTLDIGFVGHRTVNSTLQHTGLVRDASTGLWKLFSNVAAQPGTTVDFTDAVFDDLQLDKLYADTIHLTGTAPSTAQGASGDLEGDIHVDDNYLYYCTQDWTASTYNMGPGLYSVSFSNYIGVAYGSFPTPQAGWTISFTTPSTITYTYTVDHVADDAGSLRIYTVETNVNYLTVPSWGDIYLTNPNPPAIWKTVPLNTFATAVTGTYSNANVASYLTANPQSGTYSNANVVAYLAGNSVPSANTAANVTIATPTNANFFYTLTYGNVGENKIYANAVTTGLRYSPSTGSLAGATTATFATSVQTTSIVAAAVGVNLFNTTASTINMGGQAANILIGNTSGVSTNVILGGSSTNGQAAIGNLYAGNIFGTQFGNSRGTTATYTGNVTAGNIITTGTYTVANIQTTGTYGNITGANVISANSVTVTTFVRTQPVAFAALPTAAAAGAGARAFITDGNTTTFASAVTGGSIYYIPVFSNGTGWYVG
jgi:hypothetical protein